MEMKKNHADSDNFDHHILHTGSVHTGSGVNHWCSGRIHCPSVLTRDGAGRWDMVG